MRERRDERDDEWDGVTARLSRRCPFYPMRLLGGRMFSLVGTLVKGYFLFLFYTVSRGWHLTIGSVVIRSWSFLIV